MLSRRQHEIDDDRQDRRACTLIERHEARKKEQEGLDGRHLARCAAGADAAGAAMGSVGLLAFALLVWQWASDHSPAVVLGAATAAWLLVAVAVWFIRKKL